MCVIEGESEGAGERAGMASGPIAVCGEGIEAVNLAFEPAGKLHAGVEFGRVCECAGVIGYSSREVCRVCAQKFLGRRYT